MFDVVKFFEKLKAGNATLLLVKGEHPEGELPTIWVHPVCKAFCPDTGKPSERREVFNLADFVQVKDATFENGMLKIALVRELPEAMKPRRIAIETAGNDNQQIEQKQTA